MTQLRLKLKWNRLLEQLKFRIDTLTTCQNIGSIAHMNEEGVCYYHTIQRKIMEITYTDLYGDTHTEKHII